MNFLKKIFRKKKRKGNPFRIVQEYLSRQKRKDGETLNILFGDREIRKMYIEILGKGRLLDVLQILSFRKMQMGDAEPVTLAEFLIFLEEAKNEEKNEEEGKKKKEEEDWEDFDEY